MLKRSLALLSTAAMLIAVGCNDTSDSSSAPATEEISTEVTTTTESSETTEADEEEHVLRILSNSDYLQNLVEDCYPDYMYIDEYTGQIGDIQVVWVSCPPNSDWDFNSVVRHKIEIQSETSAYDKIDIIVADSEVLPNYMENGYVLPLSGIGITSEDTSEMYPYTLTAGSYDGKLMGLAFEVTPVVFTYRRDIAKEVLGTDDPEIVAQHIADMEAFTATAELMKESGYHILSTADDLYYAYKSAITPAVISDGEALLDSDLFLWAEQAKRYVDNGYITPYSMWGEEWASGMTMSGDVFGYLLPTWAVFWTLPEQAGDAGIGNYAICTPPSHTSYTHWGGTYVCAANGTDDPELVAEFMRTLTGKETSTTLAQGEQKNFANHMAAMDELAAASEGEEFLGGQNALALFSECAKLIEEPAQTCAGISIDQYFRESMHDYILGRTTYDKALAEFRENTDRFITSYQGG